MDNFLIAENFSLLAKLMDIHGDNSFKAKSYSSAAFTIDRLTTPLAEMTPDKIAGIRGIGDSVAKKIVEQLETGNLSVLTDYLQKTPPGILEMLSIKGIGPKKIATIWKELEIESLGELLYACNENRLTLYKGFGEKTQNNIREAIEFYMNNQGSFLYQQLEDYAAHINTLLNNTGAGSFLLTGEFQRQMEVINTLEWATDVPVPAVRALFEQQLGNDTGKAPFEVVSESDEYLLVKVTGDQRHVSLGFHCVAPGMLHAARFRTSSSAAFIEEWTNRYSLNEAFDSEDAIFRSAGISPIPAFLREKAAIIELAVNNAIPSVIQPEDITGIIHSHSNWSDGVDSLEKMAVAAKMQGKQFLVISDHSKTAFYANGLSEERIAAQHQQVDELNATLAPFRIFKSIESDILNDGSLDYAPEVLNSFDLVIASVHSNLKMPEEKAMMRLLKAIENPYTSILGHMTGRLLLSRNGYPVDHRKIIDACAANGVVIELNAHPRRLDIDWRWIDLALEKNVLISIDPDAHSIEGFDDCRYGVLAAQKAGLTKEQNLSSFSLAAFGEFVAAQKRKRP